MTLLCHNSSSFLLTHTWSHGLFRSKQEEKSMREQLPSFVFLVESKMRKIRSGAIDATLPYWIMEELGFCQAVAWSDGLAIWEWNYRHCTAAYRSTRSCGHTGSDGYLGSSRWDSSTEESAAARPGRKRGYLQPVRELHRGTVCAIRDPSGERATHLPGLPGCNRSYQRMAESRYFWEEYPELVSRRFLLPGNQLPTGLTDCRLRKQVPGYPQ